MDPRFTKEIAWRKDKQNFIVSQSTWFRSELLGQIMKLVESDWVSEHLGLIDRVNFGPCTTHIYEGLCTAVESVLRISSLLSRWKFGLVVLNIILLSSVRTLRCPSPLLVAWEYDSCHMVELQ